MTKQSKVPTALCKQVALHLQQDDQRQEVLLTGDCLLQECLLLLSDVEFQAGAMVSLQVEFFGQSFTVQGVLKSSRQRPDETWALSFKLKNADDLQTRMLLQLSRMEQYRNDKASEGRLLSIDEAACEWIAQYAEEFAKEFDAIAPKKETPLNE